MLNEFSQIFPEDEPPAGTYIHVPFCLGKCYYCAFTSTVYDKWLEKLYLDAIIQEIQLRSIPHPVNTVYFGGGTPSLLKPEHFSKILETCHRNFQMTDDLEVTIEVNPASASYFKLLDFRLAGANRASLGIQSFHDTELRAMGRLHNSKDAFQTFDDLRRAGFDNISIDLIAGYPCQSRKSVKTNLKLAIELNAEHISIYLLEVKASTKLYEMIAENNITPPDDDLMADMYTDICSLLCRSGYEHYEISNFALPGKHSIHNLKYWQDAVYIGLGPGAHGMTGCSRYENVEDIKEYNKMLLKGLLPEKWFTELTPETRFKDALIMGLRLIQGINIDQVSSRYGIDAATFINDTIGDLSPFGLFVIEGNNLKLTDKGRLLSNVIFSRWV